MAAERVRSVCGHQPFLPRAAKSGPLPIAAAVDKLGTGHHGSLDPAEGAIWRLERAGRVLLLAKYVQMHKVDGALLPEHTGQAAVWNWLPAV